MGVLLQGFYKRPVNKAVPSPVDGDPSTDWWWDHLARKANEIKLAGFTAVWLPPVLKTSAGTNPGADGYGPFDDYDIGSRNQKGGLPTRFGTREQLQRCVAVMRGNGLDVYLDMVEHHRSGDTTPFVFRYPGADGTSNAGRFPKNPSNFVPQVARDPNLGGPAIDDFPFGREFAPINAQPPRYVFENLIAAADWLTRALDVQGYRIDDVKGISTDFLRPFLDSKSMAGKFAVGEYFDGNRLLINAWIFNPFGMQARSSAFDFPLKFILDLICNNPGRTDMSVLDHVGLAGISPLNAVTFVENHDTDLTNSEKMVSNKALAYAYILTSEGYPCVYYRDYSTEPECYGLKPQIDNLIWIHEKLADGATQERWKDFNVFAYERLGGSHLLVGLNNDPATERNIFVATGFGRNVALHDYTGHAPDVSTDASGNVAITIPRNTDGLGYVCYSPAGQTGSFEITPHPVTQDFDGAADLDILPALSGKPIKAARVWCSKNSQVRAVLKPITVDWTSATTIALKLLGPEGNALAEKSFSLATAPGEALEATTQEEGYYSFIILSAETPATNTNPPFTLSVTYLAPATPNFANVMPSDRVVTDSSPSITGQWSAIIDLPNVPIHTHVLPTGKVLFWGRRNPPGNIPAANDFPSLNAQSTHAFIWDPANPSAPAVATSNQPTNQAGAPINLFCSGHTFLPDGRLLVTGGHLFDSQGLNASTFYEASTDQWEPGPSMNNGRWYPTAITLPDGRVFVLSGSFPTGPLQPPLNANTINNIPQILDNGTWRDATNFEGLPLFPRLHIAPSGAVFMSGYLTESYYFQDFGSDNRGTWVPIAARGAGICDYAPSVMYDVGKVIFIGGGFGSAGNTPTNVAEIIDLNSPRPSWAPTNPMHFHRRQHNATLLPDGTVLVLGGTGGPGFDNLDENQPVHTPEIWDPSTGTWTRMAPEAVDRCYHSTAVLLPDGRVFSGGGGEYAPVVGVDQSNPPESTHSDAQIFSPPYLFKGARPVITTAPAKVAYGDTFEVDTPSPGDIDQVTWIRLPSVTHSFDQNQRINFLPFELEGHKLSITAPNNSNVCPPGHYMLFLLNKTKVPSEAAIIQILAEINPAAITLTPKIASASAPLRMRAQGTGALSPVESDRIMQDSEPGPAVVVGVTPSCPYGISACWGGAYEALQKLQGVRLVRPVPNAKDSTAFVYLNHEGVPDLNLWPQQFDSIAKGAQKFRGVEITVQGLASRAEGDSIILQGTGARPALVLQPIEAADKIQWDPPKASPQSLTPDEANAYRDLQAHVANHAGPVEVSITGPLLQKDDGNTLEVRQFSLVNLAPTS